MPWETLYNPLEGPRDFIIEQCGPYTLRRNAKHEAAAVGAVVERRLLEAERQRRIAENEWRLA